MPNSSQTFLRQGLLFVCGLLILIASLAVSGGGIFAGSQGRQKRVSQGTVLRKSEEDPVRITKLKVGETDRSFGDEFDESDDWLKKLSFEIENNWNKPIVFLLVSLDFPETKSSGNEMRFYVYAGNEPGSAFPPKNQNIYIAPGDKLILNLAERYERLAQFLQTRQSMNQINKVEIQITRAVFDDKTAWGGGEFFIQDPNKPSRYVPVSAQSPAR